MNHILIQYFVYLSSIFDNLKLNVEKVSIFIILIFIWCGAEFPMHELKSSWHLKLWFQMNKYTSSQISKTNEKLKQWTRKRQWNVRWIFSFIFDPIVREFFVLHQKSSYNNRRNSSAMDKCFQSADKRSTVMIPNLNFGLKKFIGNTNFETFFFSLLREILWFKFLQRL